MIIYSVKYDCMIVGIHGIYQEPRLDRIAAQKGLLDSCKFYIDNRDVADKLLGQRQK